MNDEKKTTIITDEELAGASGGSPLKFTCPVCGVIVKPTSEEVWEKYKSRNFVCINCAGKKRPHQGPGSGIT